MQYDRFIPNRSAMDMDFAQYAIAEARLAASGIKQPDPIYRSPDSEAYIKGLAEVMGMNRTRILAFKDKPPVVAEPSWYFHHPNPPKPRRFIPQTPERVLDALHLMDDYCLNLLDWGSRNVLAIALLNTVYLWDAANASTTELLSVDEDTGPVTSLSWAPDGCCIAVGLNSSEVQLWDTLTKRNLRTLDAQHTLRVGALTWKNDNILTTGGMDGLIFNCDVRNTDSVVHKYKGHRQEVCRLKWSSSGQQLASGGKDKLLHIWDQSVVSSNAHTQWLHRLHAHTDAVKALAWCPYQSNLLASGGDQRIKFWNTRTGSCLNSVDTASEICALLWNGKERELLSSHGDPQNHLKLWKYPSMDTICEIAGHTSRVLFMTQSPDGCTVAAASEDERLFFWNVFGTTGVAKPALKTKSEPFAHIRGIR